MNVAASREALEWAARAVGESRPAEVVRVLTGGTHAGTLLPKTPAGRMVLRRFPEGDGAAANEARVLTAGPYRPHPRGPAGRPRVLVRTLRAALGGGRVLDIGQKPTNLTLCVRGAGSRPGHLPRTACQGSLPG